MPYFHPFWVRLRPMLDCKKAARIFAAVDTGR
jgi:hypothetical protein